MAIVLLASGPLTAGVPTLGSPYTLGTVTIPGFYLLDVDISAIQGGDTGATVQLNCNVAAISGGTKTQGGTTGAVSCPIANGNGHIQLQFQLCGQQSPGADFIITHSTSSGNKRPLPWALWQVS